MMDEYADKMSRKTLPELYLYVQRRAEYREQAVLAALDELERRGQPPLEAAGIRAELLPVVEQQRQAQQARENEKTLSAPVASARPAPEGAEADPLLYSPTTIVLFSMLPMSMMLGGGVLLGMNLFRLGRKRALLGLVLFIAVYLVLGSKLLTWAVMQQGLNPLLGTLLFNVPAVLAYLLWFWPRYVHTDTYRSRSLLPPIIVCFLVVWGMQKALPYLIQQQPKEVQKEIQQLMRR